jgi:glycosyltransferase involved in cell wall biosynthesis
MAPEPKVIAVIAAYNEARAIEAVIRDLAPHVTEIVVVDDGSADGTAQAARRAGAVVLRHPINRGQGAALQSGIALALARGAGIVVTFDADGQHRGADVGRLVDPVLRGVADVALGSRFLGSSSSVPPLRRLLLKGAVLFTRLTTGLSLTDAHNGLRALSRKAAETIRIKQDRMAHASEIVSEIARHELRFVEVPITVLYTDYSRGKGQSALGAFRILLDLLVGKGVR